jgi:hypothetical protein
MNLAPTDSLIRTVQLHRAGDERELPILPLGSGATLALDFDLMSSNGRPLTVYFYHADRTWQRDLVPAEYMTTFQNDNLFNYTPSRATDIPYTHYTYRFPNQNVGFRISGNYILRVTEQGREDEPLFERPFFVSEQATSLEFALDNVIVSGQSFAAVQPIALFTPPPDIQANIFSYNVCFVRNGRFGQARCVDNPSLHQQPALRFYLDPQGAFPSEGADYFLDLGNIRVGPHIAATDLSQSPFLVTLEPDFAKFSGSGLDPLLNGQPVVAQAVDDVPEPQTNGEYVRVEFSYVPPNEQALPGEVYVIGSFNGWKAAPANKLRWVAARSRYEGSAVMKQGQYEYRYHLTSSRARQTVGTSLPRPDNLYMAFAYYDDIRLNTDRLLAVNGALSR